MNSLAQYDFKLKLSIYLSIRSNSKLQVRLHRRRGGLTIGIAKAEQDVLEVRALGKEDSAIREAMHLDAQVEPGFAKILDAVLAFEAVLDPLDLVEMARQIGGSQRRGQCSACAPTRCGRRCRRRLGALVAESFQGRVNPVIPETAGLLEAIQHAIKFEDLAVVGCLPVHACTAPPQARHGGTPCRHRLDGHEGAGGR